MFAAEKLNSPSSLFKKIERAAHSLHHLNLSHTLAKPLTSAAHKAKELVKDHITHLSQELQTPEGRTSLVKNTAIKASLGAAAAFGTYQAIKGNYPSAITGLALAAGGTLAYRLAQKRPNLKSPVGESLAVPADSASKGAENHTPVAANLDSPLACAPTATFRRVEIHETSTKSDAPLTNGDLNPSSQTATAPNSPLEGWPEAGVDSAAQSLSLISPPLGESRFATTNSLPIVPHGDAEVAATKTGDTSPHLPKNLAFPPRPKTSLTKRLTGGALSLFAFSLLSNAIAPALSSRATPPVTPPAKPTETIAAPVLQPAIPAPTISNLGDPGRPFTTFQDSIPAGQPKAPAPLPEKAAEKTIDSKFGPLKIVTMLKETAQNKFRYFYQRTVLPLSDPNIQLNNIMCGAASLATILSYFVPELTNGLTDREVLLSPTMIERVNRYFQSVQKFPGGNMNYLRGKNSDGKFYVDGLFSFTVVGNDTQALSNLLSKGLELAQALHFDTEIIVDPYQEMQIKGYNHPLTPTTRYQYIRDKMVAALQSNRMLYTSADDTLVGHEGKEVRFNHIITIVGIAQGADGREYAIVIDPWSNMYFDGDSDQLPITQNAGYMVAYPLDWLLKAKGLSMYAIGQPAE
jgi:hypothetical protein